MQLLIRTYSVIYGVAFAMPFFAVELKALFVAFDLQAMPGSLLPLLPASFH